MEKSRVMLAPPGAVMVVWPVPPLDPGLGERELYGRGLAGGVLPEAPPDDGCREADPGLGRVTVSVWEHPAMIATSAAQANARFIGLLRSLGLRLRLRW